MGRQERDWERPARRDDSVGAGARMAMGLLFLIVQFGTMVILGWSVVTLVLGFVLGVVVLVGVSKLMIANREPRGGPPKQLL